MATGSNKIVIRGARVHNLKNINVDIPKNKFVVITGLSGSGKSSLAFDTIYAEGQRRYVESLSSYARNFLEVQDRPDVDEIRGLSPTIAIDQRTTSSNPRSTVGTITEIYDYLRLLYARVGKPFCILCGAKLVKQTKEGIVEEILKLIKKEALSIYAPVIRDEKGEHKGAIDLIKRNELCGVRIDDKDFKFDELRAVKLDKTRRYSIDAIVAKTFPEEEFNKEKLVGLIKKGLDVSKGSLKVLFEESNDEQIFSENLICQKCHLQLPLMDTRFFSFNSPHGACPACTGLGSKKEIDPELVMPNKKLTLAQGAIKPWTRIAGNQAFFNTLLEKVAEAHNFSLSVPVGELSDKHSKIVLYGTGNDVYSIGATRVSFEGVVANLEKRYKETDSDYVRAEIESYMRETICPLCKGKRLRGEALAVKFVGCSIADIVALPIDEAYNLFANLISEKGNSKIQTAKSKQKTASLDNDDLKITRPIVREILVRLKNLIDVGLDYLTLDRPATTLSGGEAQRVRISTQLNSNLSGVIYVLDEPSIGLHSRDVSKLVGTLKNLRDLSNTVVVVEHDADTISQADYVIDVGPGAGEYGGEIIAKGTPAELKKNKKSLTGAYLSGKMEVVSAKEIRKKDSKSLIIKGASGFNLRNIDVEIPLGKFICITGVSGSGKSTLIVDTLAKALSRHFYRAKDEPAEHKTIKGLENIDKVITIDQSPIGRTPRSNPATYTGVFTNIRDLYAELTESQLRGYDAGKFSFNVKGGGRCEACSGEGYMCIEMHFMPDVFVECKDCRGKRYNHEALEVLYKEKTIADVLEMTVREAKDFFTDQSNIFDKLSILSDVGLGYIRLGQPANNLSGGEAQRVKLATELSRRETGRTLYILDEPTTGLHFEDIKKLLGVLNQLVDKGNTVLVIEHNLDVIKSADWVIDMGPGGGKYGGEVVAEGAPRDIARVKASITGQYLKNIL